MRRKEGGGAKEVKGGRGVQCRIRRGEGEGEVGGGRRGGDGDGDGDCWDGRRVRALGRSGLRLRAIGCLLLPQLGEGLLTFFGYCFSYDRFELFCC